MKWSIELINQLEWKRFEELCAEYFKEKGRNLKVTKLGPDGGIDIHFYHHYKPNEVSGIAQCKAWAPDRNIGVKEIRELYGLMNSEKCNYAVFIATCPYTKEAKKFAADKHIILWSAKEMLREIKNLPSEAQEKILLKITKGDFETPTCVRCGIKMVKRKKFWGCKNYPKGCRNKIYYRKKKVG